MRISRLLVPILVTAFLAGCASAGTGPRPPRTDPDLLTRAELEATMQTTALAAVRQARPAWLRTRGPNSIQSSNPILVYVDGVRTGTIRTLDGIPVLAVELMRYYGPSEAQARFGLNNTNGAIEVITRKG